MSLSSRIAHFVEQFRAWLQNAPSLDPHSLQLQSNNWSYRLSNICSELQTNSEPTGELGLLKVLVPAFNEIYSKSPKGPINLKYIKQVVELYDEESPTPVPPFFQLPEHQSAPAPTPAPAAPAPAPAPPRTAAGSSRSSKRKADQEVLNDADESDHLGKKPKKPRSKSVFAPSVKPEPRSRRRPRKSEAFIEEDGEFEQQPAATITTIKLPPCISKSPAAASSKKQPSRSDKNPNDGAKKYKVNNPPCDRCRANGEECHTYSNSKGCYYCMKVSKQHCSLMQQSMSKGKQKAVDVGEASGAETAVELGDESDMENEAASSPLQKDTCLQDAQDPPMDVNVHDHGMNIDQPAHNVAIRPGPPHQRPIPPAIPGLAVPSAIAHIIPTLATVQGYIERVENLLTHYITESKTTNEELRGEIQRIEQWTWNRILSMWEDVARMNQHAIHELLEKLQSLVDSYKALGDVSQPPPLRPRPPPADPQPPPALQHSPVQEGQNEHTSMQDGSTGQRSRSHSEAGPSASVLVSLPPPVNALSPKPNSQEGSKATDITMCDIVNVDVQLQEGAVQEASAEKH